jgi:hypothetical protein
MTARRAAEPARHEVRGARQNMTQCGISLRDRGTRWPPSSDRAPSHAIAIVA